jgi:ribosomal protein S19
MKRSKKKGPFTLIIKRAKYNVDDKNIVTLNRNYEITSQTVDVVCQTHNGKNFSKLSIDERMIGHKIGEFYPTRATFIFKKKKKKK